MDLIDSLKTHSKQIPHKNNRITDSQHIGEIFEDFACVYLNKIKGWKCWRNEHIPSIELKKSGLETNKDYGSDILCKTEEGNYVLCQCKFRGHNKKYKNISKTIYNSFFAEAWKHDNCSILIFTTMTTTKKFNTWLKGNEDRVEIIDLEFIENNIEDFKSIFNIFINIPQKRYIPLSPRTCQSECLEIFKNKNPKRCVIQMICGVGKTLLSTMITREIYKENCVYVYVAPFINLADQIVTEVKNELDYYNCDIAYLNVASRTSTNRDNTTNKDEIVNFLKTEDTCFLMSTYDSLKVTLEALKKSKRQVKLIVFDEAHNLVKKSTSVKMKGWIDVFDDDYLPIDYRVFMTATPKIMKGSKISMNNKKIFGEVIFQYGYDRGIIEKTVTPYIICVYDVKNSDEYEKYVSQIGTKNNMYEQYINMIIDAIRNGCTKMLIFMASIKDCNSFKIYATKTLKLCDNLLPFEELSIQPLHSGLTNPKYQERQCLSFKYSILLTVDMYCEGINIPSIDSVFLFRIIESEIKLTQAILRCCRIFKGKKLARVYVPSHTINIDGQNEFVEGVSANRMLQIIYKLIKQEEKMYISYPKQDTKITIKKLLAKSSSKKSSSENNSKDDIEIEEEEMTLVDIKEILGIKEMSRKDMNMPTSLQGVILTMVCNQNRDTGIFTPNDIQKHIPELQKITGVLKGKTPDKSISREITVNLVQVKKLAIRLKTGIYKSNLIIPKNFSKLKIADKEKYYKKFVKHVGCIPLGELKMDVNGSLKDIQNYLKNR